MDLSLPPGVGRLLAGWLFLAGAVVGSFLNVVIARLPADESIVYPGSHCRACGRKLPWYENLPLVSYLAQRGRCRGCGAKIPPRYLLIEGLTACLFLACWVRFGWSARLPLALGLVSLAIVLAAVDLEHWILPFSITLPGIALGLLCSVPLGLLRVRDAAIGAAAGFLIFWAMEWLGEKAFKKEALGGGDKYLVAMIGAFLTHRSLLGVMFLSSFQGAIVGSTLLLLRGRAGPAPKEPAEGDPAAKFEDDWVPGPTNLPFGPWLCLAALELLFLGPWAIDLFRSRMIDLLIGSS